MSHRNTISGLGGDTAFQLWWALNENALHSLVYLHPKLMNYLKGLGGVCSLTAGRCVARGGLSGFKNPTPGPMPLPLPAAYSCKAPSSAPAPCHCTSPPQWSRTNHLKL